LLAGFLEQTYCVFAPTSIVCLSVEVEVSIYV
jgi:hypothetical protein